MITISRLLRIRTRSRVWCGYLKESEVMNMKKYKYMRNGCVAMVVAMFAGFYLKMGSWDFGLIPDKTMLISGIVYFILAMLFGCMGYLMELKYQDKLYESRKKRMEKCQMRTKENRNALMKKIEKPIFNGENCKDKHIA